MSQFSGSPQAALDYNSTIIGALELSEKKWILAALSHSPSIGAFWAISIRPPDTQIIDFARVNTSGAVDK